MTRLNEFNYDWVLFYDAKIDDFPVPWGVDGSNFGFSNRKVSLATYYLKSRFKTMIFNRSCFVL